LNVLFTGELQFRSPTTLEEIHDYEGPIEGIRRAMIQGHMSSLYFFNEVIDRRKLQNEFLLNQPFLNNGQFAKQSYSFPISLDSFTYNQRGEIYYLDIENIKTDPLSCVYLYFNIDIFREEVVNSLTRDENCPLKKESSIFWDTWNCFKTQ